MTISSSFPWMIYTIICIIHHVNNVLCKLNTMYLRQIRRDKLTHCGRNLWKKSWLTCTCWLVVLPRLKLLNYKLILTVTLKHLETSTDKHPYCLTFELPSKLYRLDSWRNEPPWKFSVRSKTKEKFIVQKTQYVPRNHVFPASITFKRE